MPPCDRATGPSKGKGDTLRVESPSIFDGPVIRWHAGPVFQLLVVVQERVDFVRHEFLASIEEVEFYDEAEAADVGAE